MTTSQPLESTDLPEILSNGLSLLPLSYSLWSLHVKHVEVPKSFKYNSDRGLRQHQLNCEEFLQADNEASTVDGCLGKISTQAPKKKAQSSLSEVSLTGSGVRDGLIFYFYTHHSL
jgi:hypothetical protein